MVAAPYTLKDDPAIAATVRGSLTLGRVAVVFLVNQAALATFYHRPLLVQLGKWANGIINRTSANVQAFRDLLNGKPFTLTGFGADGSTAADWQGGAMLSLPGGCKIGMRFVVDSRAPEQARQQVSAAKELPSNDTNVRALRATVAEILIGY